MPACVAWAVGTLSFPNSVLTVSLGCVCVRLLTACRSEDEVWDHLWRHYTVRRDDPSTWDNDKWPGLHRMGILGSIPVLSPQLHGNRFNPVIQVSPIIKG